MMNCDSNNSTIDDLEMARSEDENETPSTTSSTSSTTPVQKKNGIPRNTTFLTLASLSDDSSNADSASQHPKGEKSKKPIVWYCLFAGIIILAMIIGVTVGVVLGKDSSQTISSASSISTGDETNGSLEKVTNSPTSPTTEPSASPSSSPSAFPSKVPSSVPSGEPSGSPSAFPSKVPSSVPSGEPSGSPSAFPSKVPSSVPSREPSSIPSDVPTMAPTEAHSYVPSSSPSTSPTTAPTPSPSISPTIKTQSPTSSPTKKYNNAEFSRTNSDLTVGVFYYPWYGNTDFNGRNYLRDEISPKQLPAIGEYDQRQPSVISKHLEMSRQANINLWVTSWWGPTSSTNRNILSIMDNKDLPGTKIALFYETTGRMPDASTRNVYDDISYAAKTFFGNPNYFRINGCPAFYIYLARNLDDRGKLVEAASIMRQAASDNGHCIYLVGDVAHGTPKGAGYRPFDALDAITEYDVFGSMGRPRYAGQSGVDKFKEKQSRWRKNAMDNGCAFMPTVTPGYNEKGVRNRLEPMSRKLTAGSGFGSLFEALLRNAVDLTDPSTGDVLMVNSWNEWHEDTQIEPVIGTGAKTTSPGSKTSGLEYEAYGNRYLNILAAATNRK